MNITIGIPTINSGHYIYSSLIRVQREIMHGPSVIVPRIVVCINGTRDYGRTRSEIERFKKDAATIPVEVIEEEKQGKNCALNRIVSHARNEHQCDIIYFFDDDISPRDRSFEKNIITLINHEERHSLPVLVGSAMLGIERSPGHFIKLKDSFIKGGIAWFLHRVFILPYQSDAERPKFCEGLSLGTFIRYMPDYPDDETGITDDTFLSNYFACQGRETYFNKGIPPIIKPPGSEVFVEISSNFSEWRQQQVRIHAGIRRSFDHFSPEERVFLVEYFRWPYAFNRESRIWPQHLAKKKLGLYIFYLCLHAMNEWTAHYLVNNNKVPDWNTAASQKSG